jgi:CTP:molybdopterin cytidylyltransferase MocA
VLNVDVPDPGVLLDIDLPEDYDEMIKGQATETDQ